MSYDEFSPYIPQSLMLKPGVPVLPRSQAARDGAQRNGQVQPNAPLPDPARHVWPPIAARFKKYLEFAREISLKTNYTPQEKADLLERHCQDFGLKGTSGQIQKEDGRILVIANDKRSCLEVRANGDVLYGRFKDGESISPAVIRAGD
jgi:hypothetical protein